MQAGGHLPPSISVARSEAEGRGVERFADGDERAGDESAQSKHVGTDAFVRPTPAASTSGRACSPIFPAIHQPADPAIPGAGQQWPQNPETPTLTDSET